MIDWDIYVIYDIKHHSMSDKNYPAFIFQKFPSLIIPFNENKINTHDLTFKNLSVTERHCIMDIKNVSWSTISFTYVNDSKSKSKSEMFSISLVHCDNIRIPKFSSPEEQEMMENFRNDYGQYYNKRATELANKLDDDLEHCIVGNCAFILDEANQALQNKILSLMKEIDSTSYESNKSKQTDDEANQSRSNDNDDESNKSRSNDNDDESNKSRSNDNDDESNKSRSNDNDDESDNIDDYWSQHQYYRFIVGIDDESNNIDDELDDTYDNIDINVNFENLHIVNKEKMY